MGTRDPWAFHNKVKEMYSWRDVAERTVAVYEAAMDTPECAIADRLIK